ncbi:MAG: LysM peptidoglycan-binding domain-containing protein [Phycisphaerales bacterium]
MTRESKLALVISITLVLLVGVLVSDHLSGATGAQFESAPKPEPVVNRPVTAGLDGINGLTRKNNPAEQPVDDTPVVIAQTQPNQGILDSAIERIRAAEPPALIGDGLFEPVDRDGVTLPPRDQRSIIQPVKPINEPVVIRQSGTQTPASSGEATWRTHTVEEGDSLYAIARDQLGSGARWPEIQKLNDGLLDGGDAIQVGMVLRIERREGVTRPAPKPVVRKPTAAAALREYVVQRGDYLGNIAADMLGSSKRVSEIVELNGLKDPNDIRVGQKLKIPAR